VSIRRAAPGDLDRLLALAAAQREEYAGYQPRFWRPAPGAVDAHRQQLTALLGSGIVLVSEPSFGYAAGALVPAPPLYDRGLSCVVEELVVEDAGLWPRVGVELLAAVRAAARERGAAEVVVVTARLDGPKRAALAAAGLIPAWEHWVGAAD